MLVKHALLLYCENMPSFSGKVSVPLLGSYGSYYRKKRPYWEDIPSFILEIYALLYQKDDASYNETRRGRPVDNRPSTD